jgi:hypothetical protein
MLEKIKKAFEQPKQYKNNFSWDTDSEPDENCIIVREAAPTEEIEVNLMMDAFNAVMRLKTDPLEVRTKKMLPEEMMKRLSDPEFLSDMSCFDSLPTGVKMFMMQIPFFKEEVAKVAKKDAQIEQQHTAAELSLLDVPSDFSSNQDHSTTAIRASNTSLALSDISNVAEPSGSDNRILRSSSSSSARSRRIHTPTPSRKPRSKKELVKAPAINPRMESFMHGFSKPAKRRRSTPSPETSK